MLVSRCDIISTSVSRAWFSGVWFNSVPRMRDTCRSGYMFESDCLRFAEFKIQNADEKYGLLLQCNEFQESVCLVNSTALENSKPTY